MKTLLALINDPLNTDCIVRYSAGMAEDLGLNLHLIYIQNPAHYTLSSGTAVAGAQAVGDSNLDLIRLEEEKRNALSSIEIKLNEYRSSISPGITVNTSVETGGMDLVINQMIEDGRADLLLLENRDEGGSWLFDSTTTGLATGAGCPSWIIPAGAQYQPYRRIVYATDYNQKDIPTLANLISMTANLSPEITALHFADPDNKEEKSELAGFRENVIGHTGYNNFTVQTIPGEKGKDIAESINDYAMSLNSSLIVVLKENKKIFDRIFSGSDTKKVIKKARLPVLVYHEKNSLYPGAE
jgi:nucleotide-binding universal stress UspA family protein